MKKIPYGITNYKEIIEGDYYYVDKTMFLQTLENEDKSLICLRPGRFGKTLFTSMMYYYYDVNSESLFDSLFKNTYVYNNPTSNKNNYYILKFDFSGISSETKYSYEDKFKNCVIMGIERFLTDYSIEYTINEEMDGATLIRRFLTYIYDLKLSNKIYVIIDEYDNFTNALLEGDALKFKNAVGKNGYVKDFYAGLKERINDVIGKIFITGICPLTLNAMTTGFNIATDISLDSNFNAMIGLTHDEVKKMLDDYNIENKSQVFGTMLDYYDGYRFNKVVEERVFNATLVMKFVKEYLKFNKIPDELSDKNLTINYGKIHDILALQNNNYYKEILDEILKNNCISGELKTDFNLELELTKDDFISLLYYFGYLTIDKKNEILDKIVFKIPNYVMKEIYGNYFIKILNDINIVIDDSVINQIFLEISNGNINTLVNYISLILKQSDNRIFMKFDEKYINLLCFGVLFNNKNINVYNEYPCSNGYIDLLILSNNDLFKYNIMVEFKYIKVSEYSELLLESKVNEARDQINKYSLDERLQTMKKYVVVYVGNELKVLEEVKTI